MYLLKWSHVREYVLIQGLHKDTSTLDNILKNSIHSVLSKHFLRAVQRPQKLNLWIEFETQSLGTNSNKAWEKF